MSAKSEKVHIFDYTDQFRMSAVPQKVPLPGAPLEDRLAGHSEMPIRTDPLRVLLARMGCGRSTTLMKDRGIFQKASSCVTPRATAKFMSSVIVVGDY